METIGIHFTSILNCFLFLLAAYALYRAIKTSREFRFMRKIADQVSAIIDTDDIDHNSRSALVKLLRTLVSEHKTTSIQLLGIADRGKWPLWALACLPDLLIQDEPNLLVWDNLLNYIPSTTDKWKIRHKYCNGRVVEMRAPDKAITVLVHLAKEIEPIRLSCPFRDERTLLGAVDDGITLVLQKLVSDQRISEEEYSGIRMKNASRLRIGISLLR